ncbi:MAG: LLM class flavin-dependent oxidoreductase, partial [Vicinamibacteria bacterium]
MVDEYDFATASVYQDLFYQPPWPALFQLAESTRRPLIGPAVVNPYLTHPVLVAANLALLDRTSGGRAYLGVGRGAFFEAIDVPQPRPLRAMREMVEIVQRFLVGDRSPYEGEIFHASEQAYLRFPVPGRRIPVLIGGWGERTARLAGEIADILKVGG